MPGGTDFVGRAFRKVGMVKETGLEFPEKDAFDGTVQGGHGNAPGFHRFFEEGIAVGAQIYVHACVQGHFCGFLQAGGHMVAAIDAVNALQVAYHKALEVPAIVQHAGEQGPVAGGGNAVNGVVAGHDRQGAVVDGRLEGRKHILFQVPGADMGRAAIVPALGNAVRDKMLEGGDNALRGRSPHHGRCQLRGQINIFSIRFFHAGPAGLAGKVNDRSVADGGALGRQFRPDNLSHLFQQFGVPAGAEANGRGKYGGADGHVPVRGFLRQEDGNTQAGGVHGIVLEGVVGPGGELGIQAGFQGLAGPGIGPESSPQHASVLLLDEMPVTVRDADRIGGHFFVHGPAQRTQQLPDLFFYAHPGDEVIGPLGSGHRSVFV